MNKKLSPNDSAKTILGATRPPRAENGRGGEVTIELDMDVLAPWLRIAACSRKGTGRGVNEDAYFVDPTSLFHGAPVGAASVAAKPSDRCHTVALSDGVGGEAGGLRAATRTMDILAALALAGGPPKSTSEAELRLVGSIQAAHTMVQREAASDLTRARMGTTVTAAALFERTLVVGSVGHSAAFIARGDRLERLTTPDTLANAAGRALSQAPDWMNRTLTQWIGSPERIEVQTVRRSLVKGDVLLLATDGLTDFVSERAIAAVLRATNDPRLAAETLVGAAVHLGSTDDVTVVVVRVEG